MSRQGSFPQACQVWARAPARRVQKLWRRADVAGRECSGEADRWRKDRRSVVGMVAGSAMAGDEEVEAPAWADAECAARCGWEKARIDAFNIGNGNGLRRAAHHGAEIDAVGNEGIEDERAVAHDDVGFVAAHAVIFYLGEAEAHDNLAGLDISVARAFEGESETWAGANR